MFGLNVDIFKRYIEIPLDLMSDYICYGPLSAPTDLRLIVAILPFPTFDYE